MAPVKSNFTVNNPLGDTMDDVPNMGTFGNSTAFGGTMGGSSSSGVGTGFGTSYNNNNNNNGSTLGSTGSMSDYIAAAAASTKAAADAAALASASERSMSGGGGGDGVAEDSEDYGEDEFEEESAGENGNGNDDNGSGSSSIGGGALAPAPAPQLAPAPAPQANLMVPTGMASGRQSAVPRGPAPSAASAFNHRAASHSLDLSHAYGYNGFNNTANDDLAAAAQLQPQTQPLARLQSATDTSLLATLDKISADLSNAGSSPASSLAQSPAKSAVGGGGEPSIFDLLPMSDQSVDISDLQPITASPSRSPLRIAAQTVSAVAARTGAAFEEESESELEPDSLAESARNSHPHAARVAAPADNTAAAVDPDATPTRPAKRAPSNGAGAGTRAMVGAQPTSQPPSRLQSATDTDLLATLDQITSDLTNAGSHMPPLSPTPARTAAEVLDAADEIARKQFEELTKAADLKDDELVQQASLKASERERALQHELQQQTQIAQTYERENVRLIRLAKDAAVRAKQVGINLSLQKEHLTADRMSLEAEQSDLVARIASVANVYEDKARLAGQVEMMHADSAAFAKEHDALVGKLSHENTALREELARHIAATNGAPHLEDYARMQADMERATVKCQRLEEAYSAESTEHAAMAATTTDLQRQVKEMEKIVQARFPDTAGVLIQATLEEGGVGHLLDAHPAAGDSSGADHVTVKGFQSLQENYARMRDQYEERVADLELRLEQSGGRADDGGDPRNTGADAAAAYRGEVKRLQSKLDAQEEELALAERVMEDAVQNKKDLDKAIKLVESHELGRRTAEDRATNYEREMEELLERTQKEKEELVRQTMERAILEKASGVLPALQNKIQSLEKVVSHLTARLQKAPSPEVLAEYNAQLREKTHDVDILTARLELAQKYHSPTMQHFNSLQSKIDDLQTRLKKRDADLQAVARDNTRAIEERVSEVETKWRRIVAGKQQQVEAFRAELDQILQILRELQRSGVQVRVPMRAGDIVY